VLFSKYDLGTRLSKGEVRKAIALSFTVMYIILLSMLFAGTADLPPLNVTYSNIITIDNTHNITTITNCTNQTIPATVYGIRTFHYVYVIIIGFYFGSRLVERIKMQKEFKNLKPLEILLKRYAMGEIDSVTFDKMTGELKPFKESKIEKIENLQKLYEMEKKYAKTFNEMKKDLDDS
jgi:hypothetical protein